MTVGLSRDLVHPDNNATGVTLMMAELNAKRLDLAREIQPGLKRIAVLVNLLHRRGRAGAQGRRDEGAATRD